MSKLAQRIKEARQTRVESGKFSFVITRPTDLEMLEMRGIKVKQRDILEHFVVGWSGVKESDLVAGGTGDLVEFEPEIWKEFIADHPEHWTPLTNAILDSYKQHEVESEAIVKN